MVVKNILITGHPGVGKTTVLKKLADRFGHLALTGFYTEEIREERSRVGFRAVTLSGHSAVFAHRDFHVPATHRVGRYGVKPEVMDILVLPHLDPLRKGADLVVIDEIAKMELLSAAFKEMVTKALDSPVPVIATISLKGSGFVKKIKDRADVALYTVTQKNRGVIDQEIYRKLAGLLKVSPKA